MSTRKRTIRSSSLVSYVTDLGDHFFQAIDGSRQFQVSIVFFAVIGLAEHKTQLENGHQSMSVSSGCMLRIHICE